MSEIPLHNFIPLLMRKTVFQQEVFAGTYSFDVLPIMIAVGLRMRVHVILSPPPQDTNILRIPKTSVTPGWRIARTYEWIFCLAIP